MNQMHYIQREILSKLLYTTSLKFNELKNIFEEIENSKFNFHLEQLKSANLVEKTEEGYKLTNLGKDYANRLDTGAKTFEKQAKISVFIIAHRNNASEFLMYTRLKHPFYGKQGFPSGKVRYGESIVEAAQRELMEECNLTGKPELIEIRHYRVFDNNKNLLEDKFMYLVGIKDPQGELKGNNEGDYYWVKDSDLNTVITNTFDDVKDIIRLVKTNNGKYEFKEVDHITDSF